MLDWKCKHTWKKAARNTTWCLIGCAIGDMATIIYFQTYMPKFPVFPVMIIAMINGILTSIALETYILTKEFGISLAFKTAIGMSLISMITMESAMNIVDYAMTGGARITLYTIPVMILAGFLSPLPYNYWRLKKHGQSCH